MDLYYGKAGDQRGAVSGQGLRCTSGLPSFPAKQVGQLGDAGCDLPRLVLSHKLRRRASARFAFEVDIGDGKAVAVPYDEADAAIFLDGPRWQGSGARALRVSGQQKRRK